MNSVQVSSKRPGVRREKRARKTERLPGCRHCHGSELGRVRTAGLRGVRAGGRASEEIDEETCVETYKELCKSSQHSTTEENLRNRKPKGLITGGSQAEGNDGDALFQQLLLLLIITGASTVSVAISNSNATTAIRAGIDYVLHLEERDGRVLLRLRRARSEGREGGRGI